MRLISCLALVMGLIFAPLAQAERVSVYRDAKNSYVGVNLTHQWLEGPLEAGSSEQNPGGMMFRFGGMMDNYWGAEVRMGRGFWHTVDRVGADTRVKADVYHIAGLYAPGRYAFDVPFIKLPLVNKLYVQGSLGVADSKIKYRSYITDSTSATPTQTRDVQRHDATDLSWGVGAGALVTLPRLRLIPFLPRNLGLSLEYFHYGDKYDAELTSIEAGGMIFF